MAVTTENVFDCKLVEYSVLYSNKIMWGMDCDIEALEIELYKLYNYNKVLLSLDTTNECSTRISPSLTQKIKQYKKALTKQYSTFCRNC